MIKFVSDWKTVLRKAWSVRLIVLAAVLSGAEVALSLVDGLSGMPSGVFAGVSALVTAGAVIARLVAQKEFTDVSPPSQN